MARVRRYGRYKPRPLEREAAVFVFAPAGTVRDPYRERGLAWLREAGFRVTTGASLHASPTPFSAGPPSVRVAEWRAALAEGYGALLPARGGYGSGELLPEAPLTETANRAPLWIGSSDLTLLQVPLLQRAGLVTFYGPMPCGSLARHPVDVEGRRHYLAALTGAAPAELRFPETAQPLRAGTATGELRGGCLSLLAAACGTPWQLDGEDALLVLEEVSEPPFRIDRFLWQLAQAGVFTGVRGLLWGTFPNCRDASGSRAALDVVLERWSERLGVPAVRGLPLGHGRGCWSLPLGVPARLEVDHGRLRLLESPYL